MSDTPVFRNNAVSVLAAAITAGATEMTVTAGDGALFPSPDIYEYGVITLTDYDTGLREIVHLTGRSGDVLSIERGQEDTTPLAFPAGAEAAMQITAGILEYFRDN